MSFRRSLLAVGTEIWYLTDISYCDTDPPSRIMSLRIRVCLLLRPSTEPSCWASLLSRQSSRTLMDSSTIFRLYLMK